MAGARPGRPARGVLVLAASNPFSAYAGHPVTLRGALGGVVVALVYGYNVFLIHVKVTPLPLGHLWTLAIEGQFYAGWVLVFAG